MNLLPVTLIEIVFRNFIKSKYVFLNLPVIKGFTLLRTLIGIFVYYIGISFLCNVVVHLV